jgi:DNA-binding MarR family transcriptional regulator
MVEKPPAEKTLRTDAAALLQDCAGVHSRVAARRISRFLDRELAASGLTTAQLGLLAQVAVAADDTLGALARRAGLDPSTLSRNLRTLEAEGLVEIAMTDSDLRRRAVWLTERGARRLEAALPLWRQANTALARHVPSALARQLAEASDLLEA